MDDASFSTHMRRITATATATITETATHAPSDTMDHRLHRHYIPHRSILFATTTPNDKSFERNRRINNRDLEEEEEEKEDRDKPEITPQPHPFVTATAAAAAAAAAAPTAPFDAENTTTTNPTMCTVVYETWICTDCGYTHVVLPYIIDGCPGLLAGRTRCSRWRDIGFEREYVCNACNLCRRAAGLPMDLGDPLARP